MFGKYKEYIIMAVIIIVGYMLFFPYLTGALGSVAGQYTTVLSVAGLAVTALWLQKKVSKKV